jgi:hypothetical protein
MKNIKDPREVSGSISGVGKDGQSSLDPAEQAGQEPLLVVDVQPDFFFSLKGRLEKLDPQKHSLLSDTGSGDWSKRAGLRPFEMPEKPPGEFVFHYGDDRDVVGSPKDLLERLGKTLGIHVVDFGIRRKMNLARTGGLGVILGKFRGHVEVVDLEKNSGGGEIKTGKYPVVPRYSESPWAALLRTRPRRRIEKSMAMANAKSGDIIFLSPCSSKIRAAIVAEIKSRWEIQKMSGKAYAYVLFPEDVQKNETWMNIWWLEQEYVPAWDPDGETVTTGWTNASALAPR